MAQLMLVNPKKRRRAKKSTAKKRVSRRRRNPIAGNPAKKRRRYSRRRRNPAGRAMSLNKMLQRSLMPSVTAASGAIGLDLLMGFAPIPDALKTGPMRHLVKGAGAIGLGWLASMFVKPDMAQQFTTGALTVTIYSAGKEAINRFMPTIGARLGDVGYYETEMMGLGYAGAGYSPYGLESEISGLGYYENEMDGLAQNDYEELNL